ncbi:protein GVQW3-like [Solenopsis invicta]|uniref:protein GVQW3-like n=1 Tax=Solenopsis invicta TaxID=13686 RepID=UPI00193DC787|nr:protein GVQW3-like [Solenopsis invicta]
MDRTVEQRYAIKFCVKLGKSATETLPLIQQAFGSDCLSKSQVFRWHKSFKEGQEEVTDEPRIGRPSTSRIDENVTRVRDCLNFDRRLSLQLIAETLNITKTTVFRIVTDDLNMKKVCAKLVPKVLTDAQKNMRVLRCQELLEMCENDPNFLNSVITGDESWIFEYDPETKRQSSEWHTPSSPRPKKARMSKSRIKTMLIVFFDVRGIVHHEFVPTGTTVNAAFYLEVLKKLKKRVTRCRSDIKNAWKLHHDNAPSHSAFVVNDFLAKTHTPLVSQPPYSPDLAPADFFLFPRLKQGLKGKHWGTITNIQAHVTSALKDIPEKAFQDAFQAWKHRLQKCIDAGGCYFEDF